MNANETRDNLEILKSASKFENVWTISRSSTERETFSESGRSPGPRSCLRKILVSHGCEFRTCSTDRQESSLSLRIFSDWSGMFDGVVVETIFGFALGRASPM